jgi:sulfur carrier protein ThiS
MSTEGEDMKKIAVKKAASTELPRDLDLEPGTTAYDVLKAIGLEPAQFEISIPNGEMLHRNDPLYSKVNDGDKLLVSERATVRA